MPLESDHLVRLIAQAARVIAAALGLEGDGDDLDALETACRTWTGLDLDAAESLSTPTLLALFAADPMSGEKAVLLGLGLGARAMTARRTGDLQRDVRPSEKALTLLDAGLRLRPDLERPELREAIGALMRERG